MSIWPGHEVSVARHIGRRRNYVFDLSVCGCLMLFARLANTLLQYEETGVQWCGNAVERRSGKYFGAGTAVRQISLATGGTLTLKRSVLVRLRP